MNGGQTDNGDRTSAVAADDRRTAAAEFGHGIAVITGSGSGIGAGLARELASHGMTVVVADICADRAAQTVTSIRKAGGSAHSFNVDVSRAEGLERLAEAAHCLGTVRMLINNAGIETVGYSWEIPVERWAQTLDINVLGVVNGCRAFLPRMIAQGEECWVANVASIGGFGQLPLQAPYIMSKHAVQSFTECLALEVELARAPIHVASIIPGMVRTAIFQATDADQGEVAIAHRKVMRETMASHGMDLEMACARIVAQLATGTFWVSTQPRMTRTFLERRADFLRDQGAPQIMDDLAPLYANLQGR